MPEPLAAALEMRGIRKSFGEIEVLHGVDFDVAEGEIHALIGENGAGKSTLTKVMAGVVSLSSGTMLIAGREVAPLTIPPGAVVVDTTRMGIDEVVDLIVRRVSG